MTHRQRIAAECVVVRRRGRESPTPHTRSSAYASLRAYLKRALLLVGVWTPLFGRGRTYLDACDGRRSRTVVPAAIAAPTITTGAQRPIAKIMATLAIVTRFDLGFPMLIPLPDELCRSVNLVLG